MAQIVYIIDMKTTTIRQGITFEMENPSEQREGFVENNDCTVRALKAAAGVPYSDAHAMMEKLGRQSRKGGNVPMLDAMTHMPHVYGYVVTKVFDGVDGLPSNRLNPFSARYRRVTLGTIVRRYRTGRYYIVITGHAIAMRDGVVIDGGTSGAGCYVKAVYKFTPSSAVPVRMCGMPSHTSPQVYDNKANIVVDSPSPIR
jgi:hypothetical protein